MRVLACGSFFAALVLCAWGQDSPFGGKRPDAKSPDGAARPEAVPISQEELDKALEDLGSEEASARRAAFEKLYASHNETKARGTLRSLLSEWTSKLKQSRKAALAEARPEGGEVASLRSKAQAMLDKGDTKSMRPIVEEMFRKVYPDLAKADAHPEYLQAASRLREIDAMLERTGDRTKRDIEAAIAKATLEIDEDPILAAMPAEAAAVASGNRGARGGLDPEEYKLVLLTNMYRAVMGRPALRINPGLCRAARGHSKDMKEKGFFSHESPIPGKRHFTERARAAGASAHAENIAQGRNAEDAFWGWFLSLGHHRNMMGPHTQIGIGRFDRYWTEMF
jgi:uncharacterized protein YkwD